MAVWFVDIKAWADMRIICKRIAPYQNILLTAGHTDLGHVLDEKAKVFSNNLSHLIKGPVLKSHVRTPN